MVLDKLAKSMVESDDNILNGILQDNARLINNKYLTFNVLHHNNELRRTCYGTIDCCLPTGARCTEAMSTASQSDELCSVTDEGSQSNLL
ncbi:ORF137 LEF-10 [Cydia pomonella granulovirus]|uniref:ORF137 LEF-10 n=2 Tax=Cydia pomonella granulosis virus TaxID=28289 RepID=Q91ER8_GVCPM|nr:ORF137 LEF-10 [Cydia pomonella granulovirus]AAK70797.1 ORF137 LEF-10 [Cydia pomonella granulovirus]AIU36783.1 ORF137 lef-10 [Cydia pomonella granulovirus]AIU36920.1 ORF137 lef-10 [Cydia pomonella granulovirus]AIU37062.1 ORF137 lef-10 [Cydia pomonella granulovirus]AIU37204.1 ORF137 lef-10 [Cydia pomonella granulovirus]